MLPLAMNLLWVTQHNLFKLTLPQWFYAHAESSGRLVAWQLRPAAVAEADVAKARNRPINQMNNQRHLAPASSCVLLRFLPRGCSAFNKPGVELDVAVRAR